MQLIYQKKNKNCGMLETSCTQMLQLKLRTGGGRGCETLILDDKIPCKIHTLDG